MRFLLILLFALLTACKPTRIPDNYWAEQPKEPKREILFLVFDIRKDSIAKQNKVTLMSKTNVAGQLKKQPDATPSTPNFLTVELLSNGKPTRTFAIEHPLFKHVEYQENGRYISKDAQVDREEFFIRVQNDRSENTVRITETLQNQTPTELITVTL